MRSRALALALVLLSMGLGASAQTPSSDQLDLLKNLPQDQQDKLMETLGGKSTGNTVKSDQKLNTPQTVEPKREGEQQPLVPYPRDKTKDGRTLRLSDEDPELRADDTVLIDLTPIDVDNGNTNQNPQNYQNYPSGNNQPPNGNGTPNAGPKGAMVNGPPDANAIAAAAANNAYSNTGTNKNQGGRSGYDYGRVKQEAKPLTDEEKADSEKIRQLILRNNPYHLNRFGVLELPGLPAIPLAGLTADEATNRLSADPDLRTFAVKVTLLRLQPFDEEALKPFGYDLFEGVPSTFAPVSDIQVPLDYLIGPGDTMNVQLYGNEPATYTLTVQRDGRINFPKLGPIRVSEMTFDEARAAIEDHVQQQLIGSRVSVTMGDLRSIRIFVLGEAEKPGSYTVSGLSTMTNALFVSGGVKKIGSLAQHRIEAGRAPRHRARPL